VALRNNLTGLRISFIAFLAMALGAFVAFLSRERPDGNLYMLSFALMTTSFVGMMVGFLVHYFEMGRGIVRFLGRLRRADKSEDGK
jgi:UDP-N-acetylmuramyl pentapeptide phosphotransferase/UDP-N-acetylglucosamine-1-phosphate transferase